VGLSSRGFVVSALSSTT